MGLLRKAIDQISDEAHYAASIFLARTGLMSRLSSFKMAMNALEHLGGEKREIEYALSKAHDFGPSFARSWKNISRRILAKGDAARAAGHTGLAQSYFHRSALYALVADWVSTDLQEQTRNYELALSAYDRLRALSVPPIEKIMIKASDGQASGYVRRPAGLQGEEAAVVFLCGNETPKEAMNFLETAALERGLTTLTVDLPGCGESFLHGSRLSSWGDFDFFMKQVGEYLGSRLKSTFRVGTFGLGFGGIFAHVAPVAVPGIRACASVGAPYDLGRTFAHLGETQRKKTFQWAGVSDIVQARTVINGFQLRARLKKVEADTLIVHGMKDEVVSAAQARALVSSFAGQAELKLIPQGDHLCTDELTKQVIPYVFKWFENRLMRSE